MLRKIWLGGSACALAFVFVSSSEAAEKVAAVPTSAISDYARIAKLISVPDHGGLNDKGESKFEKTKWSTDKQADGSEIYTLKAKPEARAVVMRSDAGALESMTAFEIAAKDKTEKAGSVFFETGKLAAFTSCEEQKNLGRVCVTTTPALCKQLKDGNVAAETMTDMDKFEMRSLSYLLTLRGADHQLDNMVKTGNRLGLKSALQTTKGQLMALVKQLAAETESKSRAPSATENTKAKTMSPAEFEQSKLALSVLSESLPRLKQACVDTGFVTN